MDSAIRRAWSCIGLGLIRSTKRVGLRSLTRCAGSMELRLNSRFSDPKGASALAAGAKRQPSPFPIEHGHFSVIHSQRNPSSLFGIGLIDRLPGSAIEAVAIARDRRFPEIKGRICRLADGRIGRFGWKAEQASLEDFVLTACAMELGLEVPGHHQGVKPEDPDYRPPGLDLTVQECDALEEFVRSLPRPAETEPATAKEALALRLGRGLFDRIGCAACHRPALGRLSGIYSDLLLHDMGDPLGSAGAYSSQLRDPADDRETLADTSFPSGRDAFVGGPRAPTPATQREWRTPPLWGVRDSGPYLHDGRAETLEQAIALHGGEAIRTRVRYFDLSADERIVIQSFLKSLVAPEAGPGQRSPQPKSPVLTSTGG